MLIVRDRSDSAANGHLVLGWSRDMGPLFVELCLNCRDEPRKSPVNRVVDAYQAPTAFVMEACSWAVIYYGLFFRVPID